MLNVEDSPEVWKFGLEKLLRLFFGFFLLCICFYCLKYLGTVAIVCSIQFA